MNIFSFRIPSGKTDNKVGAGGAEKGAAGGTEKRTNFKKLGLTEVHIVVVPTLKHMTILERRD